MAKVPLGLRLDPVTIAAIDQARGQMPRTTWIEAAISHHLGAMPHQRPPGADDIERAIHDAELGSPARAVAILRAALDRAAVT